MGQQKGPLRLKGSHEDFTFAETADGYIWKKKVKSITKDRIQTDPKFAAVRDNMLEFGRAGKAVKLIRTAFEKQLDKAKDRKLTPRLHNIMMQVVLSDTINGRGARLAKEGNLSLLENVEMNIDAELHRSMPVDFDTVYDRVAGTVQVNIPAFSPTELRHTPKSTHYTIVLATAEFDFEKNAFIRSVDSSAVLPLDNTLTAPLTLNATLTPASTLPVLILVGIQYTQIVNGFPYPQLSGEFNALRIVKTDRP